MNTFTRAACVLMAIVHGSAFAASASELLNRISAFDCEAILVGQPPVDPGPKPKPTNAWLATANFVAGNMNALSQHRAAKAEIAAHEEASAEYRQALSKVEQRRTESLQWWRGAREAANVGLAPSLRPVTELLDVKIERSLKEARSVEAVRSIRTAAEGFLREVATENEELRQQLRRAELERRRRQRADELRFDASKRDNAADVARAFETVAGGVATPQNLVERLRNDLDLKSFVIDEVQLLRRLRKASASPRVQNQSVMESSLNLRLANDRAVIEGAEPSTVTQLRRALLSLNRPGLFRDLGGAAPRRTNLELREKIVADALANEALAVTIMQAGLELMPPPSAPAVPRQPSLTPPTKPNVPRKARDKAHYRRIKSSIETYQREVKEWQAAWAKYKTEVPRYKESTFPAYVERVKRLREAYDRTAKARQSFVAYLSYRQPSAFLSPAVAEKMASAKTEGARARLSAGAQSTAATYVRSSVPSSVHSSSTTYTSSNDDWFLYWLLYNNTLNPYYAVNPHGAYAAYQHDAAHCAVGSGTGLYDAVPALPPEVRDQINQFNQDFTPSIPDLSTMPDAPADVIAPDLSDPVGAAQDWAGQLDPNVNVADALGLSDFSSPASLPDVSLPDVTMPDVSSPDFSMPDIPVPSVDVSTPSFDTPSMPSSDYSSSYSSPSYDSGSLSSSYDSGSSSSSYDSGSSSSSFDSSSY